MVVNRSSSPVAKKSPKQPQKNKTRASMDKKSLKDNPPSHTSPVPAKRKLGSGTSKNTKSKYPQSVLENSDFDFEFEPKFQNLPNLIRFFYIDLGNAKYQVKIVQSTDLFEDIIGKRVVEVWESKIENPSTPDRNTTILEL
ncbi:hypothetical protein CsatB_019060 [Cannabis sativa]